MQLTDKTRARKWRGWCRCLPSRTKEVSKEREKERGKEGYFFLVLKLSGQCNYFHFWTIRYEIRFKASHPGRYSTYVYYGEFPIKKVLEFRVRAPEPDSKQSECTGEGLDGIINEDGEIIFGIHMQYYTKCTLKLRDIHIKDSQGNYITYNAPQPRVLIQNNGIGMF
jgi:hypothetical protein